MNRPITLSPHLAYALLALLLLSTILFHGGAALHLHAAFVTGADDLSNIDQVAWNSQHGRILERTTGTRSVPRYGEHLEPLWIALGLLYTLWDDVRALLLAQTVALALGALPTFWLARAVWGQRNAPDQGAGLVFAALYLLSPFVARASVAEVHALPFAVAPLMLAIFWGWRGQWQRVAPLVVLLLLVREDAGLLVAALGLWALLARRAVRPGLALLASGLGGVALAVFGIIPRFADERFSGQEQSIFFERYAAFGEGPAGVLWGMLTRPDLWAELLADPWRLTFLRDLLLSTGGLALVAPLAWLLLAPHLLLNLLSDYFGQFGGLQHYGAPLVPGLIAAAIFGGARLLHWGRGNPWLRRGLLTLALAGALADAQLAIWQPLALSWIQPPVTPHHRLLAEIAAPIPPRAPLSADPQLHPHLAHRPDAYRFPTVGDNAEWILVDVTTNRTQHPADLQREIRERLDDGWGIAAAQDGYLLLQRGAPTKPLPAPFFSFTQPDAPPTTPLRARLGNALEVLGYDMVQDFWGRVSIRWHLRPLTPLPPFLTLEAALLGPDGLPLPDTANQPIPALVWLPLTAWQPGENYVIQTLPREADPAFQPALSLRADGLPLPVTPCEGGRTACGEVRDTTEGAWLVGGAWELRHRHAQRGVAGWRRWEPPAPLAEEPGEWAQAWLGAWEIVPPANPSAPLTLTLHWQATQEGLPPMQRFVHLVPPNGAPVPLAQADGPLGGDYPAPRWASGEWVSETITLPLPADLPPGWRLLVGLYDPAIGTRHPVTPDAGSATFELPMP